jgi:hypothetical protein
MCWNCKCMCVFKLKSVTCDCWIFVTESVCSAANLLFIVETELSAANQRSLLKVCVLQRICDSLPKVCWLQRISVHCRKCDVCNEIAIRCRSCVVFSESMFAAESVLSAVKLWFAIKTKLFVANQRSLPKVWCLQRNCDSLLKLHFLQWISVRFQKCIVCSEIMIHYRNWVGCNESAFIAESVMPATKLWFAAEVALSLANQCSLLKVYCLQRNCDLLLKLSHLQQINVRYRKCNVCSEIAIRY